MSMESLCQTHSFTRKRETETRGASGGAAFTYTTAGTFTGRLQPRIASVFQEIAKQGMQISHTIYCTSDPGCDERDIIYYGTRRFEIKGLRDTDELGRLWVIAVLEKKHEVD